MKLTTPTKVQLAMAIADLHLALTTAAAAAHHNGQHEGTGRDAWRQCQAHGCLTMARFIVLHADAIQWAKETAPPA